MVVLKIVGIFVLWLGIAMYPVAEEEATPETWNTVFQNLLDSFPIILGVLLLIFS